MRDMKDIDLAKLIFAAIVIGGSTLRKYLNVLEGVEEKRSTAIHRKLKDFLRYELYFDDLYAKWLSENLHRLNDSSVKLLESLDRDDY